MNKAVLISIQPKWCELIARGEKIIEVRKTAPKLQTPFKCYIYCTKSNGEHLLGILKEGDENYGCVYHGKTVFIKGENGSVCDMYNKRQKVIGEFVCDKLYTIRDENYGETGFIAGGVSEEQWSTFAVKLLKSACLSVDEAKAYLQKEYGWCWHISNLKIYDKPKELGEFKTVTSCKDWKFFEICSDVCGYAENNQCHDGMVTKRVTNPPQSWCYVEELKI